ncbi:MAG TPA: hypothetical protein PLA71_00025 [Saccharofermentans sp.]|nr:hypothetical protein [Saccharofermentans sp.]
MAKEKLSGVAGMLKNLRKDLGCTSFKESKYGKPTGYIDTSCYALNRIITGSIYTGIPSGRVTILGGESQTGKSYIMAKMFANAMKQSKYEHAFFFDSEGGALSEFFENQGMDTSNIEHILVRSVEEAKMAILKVLDYIEQVQKAGDASKFICALDSLGALVSNKDIVDAVEKDKVVVDMGTRARVCNSMMKSLTIPCLKTDTPFIVTNHVYDDPSAMFASKLKSQSGGKGAQYMCRVGLQLTKSWKKSEEESYDGFYGGTLLTFFSYKNSFAKPFHEATMYLDFTEGPGKYDGLVDDAVKYGLVEHESGSQFYGIKGYDKKLRLKDLIRCDEGWKGILDEFDAMSIKDMKYHSANDEVLEELVEEESESN